jgi:hypothetical protein
MAYISTKSVKKVPRVSIVFFFLQMRQCWASVTFWCGSGSGDPKLRITDLDPTPDLNPFFSDFQDAKKNFFSYFFSYNLPASTLSSIINLLY